MDVDLEVRKGMMSGARLLGVSRIFLLGYKTDSELEAVGACVGLGPRIPSTTNGKSTVQQKGRTETDRYQRNTCDMRRE
jgi:hypothetical protein